MSRPCQIRPEWLFELSQRVQRFVHPAELEDEVLLKGLPGPASSFEQLLLRLASRRIRTARLASPRSEREMLAPGRDATLALRHSRTRAAHLAAGILKRDFAAPWTLSTLSRRVRSNRTDLEAGVRAVTGMSVRTYLTSCRIEGAKQLLRTTAWQGEAIAQAVGYRAKGPLHHNFRRFVGMTPEDYRRRWMLLALDRRAARAIIRHWSPPPPVARDA